MILLYNQAGLGFILGCLFYIPSLTLQLESKLTFQGSFFRNKAAQLTRTIGTALQLYRAGG